LRFLGWRQESIWYNPSSSQHADANHTMALRKKLTWTRGPAGVLASENVYVSAVTSLILYH
jgi:hypothetical protein